MDDGYLSISDGATTWRFETGFLRSNWQCIWGRGCLGIHEEPAPHLRDGCCSVGAELDADETMTLAASAAALRPELFQYHAQAAEGILDGVAGDGQANTRVIDGACIFLNRPGFAGGEGCALHLAAVAAGEDPIDWKPSVCWQLPIRVEWAGYADGTEVATVRRWSRADWGAEGATMAWCCTEGELAYTGERPVIDSLGGELRGIVGETVYVELRRRLA